MLQRILACGGRGMNGERERLIELLLESEPIKERDLDDGWGDNEISDIAEHLLENGVIVPPVNIGQTVYHSGYPLRINVEFENGETITYKRG